MGGNKVKTFFSKVFAHNKGVLQEYDRISTPEEVCTLRLNEAVGTHYSEMESINNSLISDMVGIDGELWKHYQRLIKNFSVNSNPLSVSDAKQILHSLLLRATIKRRSFPIRLAHSIGAGNMFRRYFGKMEYINQLYIAAYQYQMNYQTAQERYDDEKKRLDRITDVSYKADYGKSEKREARQSPDIWGQTDSEDK